MPLLYCSSYETGLAMSIFCLNLRKSVRGNWSAVLSQSAITYGRHSSIKLFEGLTANNSIRVVAFCVSARDGRCAARPANGSILYMGAIWEVTKMRQQMVAVLKSKYESAKRKSSSDLRGHLSSWHQNVLIRVADSSCSQHPFLYCDEMKEKFHCEQKDKNHPAAQRFLLTIENN